MSLSRIILACLLWPALAACARQPPATRPVLNERTSQGCVHSSALSASSSLRESMFMSTGLCVDHCRSSHMTLAAVQSMRCVCSSAYLSTMHAARVPDEACSTPCPGYALEACGGEDAYSVYATGLEIQDEPDSSHEGVAAGEQSLWTDVWEAGARLADEVQRFFRECAGRRPGRQDQDRASVYSDSTFSLKNYKEL